MSHAGAQSPNVSASPSEARVNRFMRPSISASSRNGFHLMTFITASFPNRERRSRVSANGAPDGTTGGARHHVDKALYAVGRIGQVFWRRAAGAVGFLAVAVRFFHSARVVHSC